jgi:hypothetical protein
MFINNISQCRRERHPGGIDRGLILKLGKKALK